MVRVLLVGTATDNFIQWLGHFYIAEEWYHQVNWLRFILHAAILPFITLFTLSVLRKAGIQWAYSKVFTGFCVLFTLTTLVYGLYADVLSVTMQVNEYHGIAKLTKVEKGPPMGTILTNLLTIILAAMLWKKDGWKWLFIGSITIFLINGATAPFPWGFLTGNFAEILFALSLLFTAKAFFVDNPR